MLDIYCCGNHGYGQYVNWSLLYLNCTPFRYKCWSEHELSVQEITMSSYHHGIQQVCSHGKGPFAHVAGATLMITCRVGRMRPSQLSPKSLPLSPQHPLLLPRSKRQCRVLNRGEGGCSGRRDGLHGQFEACAGGAAHGVSSL